MTVLIREDGNIFLRWVKDINRTFGLQPYESFDAAWIAVIKMANMLPGSSEHDRLVELGNRLSDDAIRHVLQSEELGTLLDLNPPLETILSFPHERLDAERAARELEQVRIHRNSNPKVALRNLVHILKRIRNRRAHGFKTPDGPRDNEILGAAVWLIRIIGCGGSWRPMRPNRPDQAREPTAGCRHAAH